jgi:hypothetical protein
MSHIDAKAIRNDPVLLANLEDYGKLVGRDLTSEIEDSYMLPQFFKVKDGTPSHSKLHLIFEKGNKCRVIAILDYFTQEMLCPLHDSIADVNSSIEVDGTFDQNKIISRVKAMTVDSQNQLFSLDLTAATDRLPIKLQSRIIDNLYGQSGLGEA